MIINQIASGGGGGSTGDATAVDSDIREGKTAYTAMGKTTGTLWVPDLTEASATENDIRAGKTAFISSGKVTGTLDTSVINLPYVELGYLPITLLEVTALVWEPTSLIMTFENNIILGEVIAI